MNKIDNKELESSILELFGSKKDFVDDPIVWLTTSGKFLYNKLNVEYFHFTHTYVYQILFTTAFTDKRLILDSQEEIIPDGWNTSLSTPKHAFKFTHNLQIGWAYAKALDRRVKSSTILLDENKEFINSMNNCYEETASNMKKYRSPNLRNSKRAIEVLFQYGKCIEQFNFNIIQLTILLICSKNNELLNELQTNQYFENINCIDLISSCVSIDEKEIRSQKELIMKFLFFIMTRMCRMTDGHQGGGSQNIGSHKKEIGIETIFPLTSSQRNSILDYIEIHNVPPERVYIDDYSKEKSVKRQLGL